MLDPTQVQGTVYPFVSLGYGTNELDAFDDAEVNAGIEALNAVKFTSFVPVGPNGRWKINLDCDYSIKNGVALPMAYQESVSKDRLVSGAIAIGLNKERDKPGIIMEYAGINASSEDLERKAVDSVRHAFERRKDLGWNLGDIISLSIEGKGEGRYCCALVGAIFYPEL
ncbi:hypothetical protein GOV09_01890 [Candidatus Woesearchaeota archaeon]|nr:hypothetical protein [Candidatus Woesearchaeota archaeon]